MSAERSSVFIILFLIGISVASACNEDPVVVLPPPFYPYAPTPPRWVQPNNYINHQNYYENEDSQTRSSNNYFRDFYDNEDSQMRTNNNYFKDISEESKMLPGVPLNLKNVGLKVLGFNPLGNTLLNNLVFNNRFPNNGLFHKPIFTNWPMPYTLNPNFPNYKFPYFDSCQSAATGEDGICVSSKACNLFGGQAHTDGGCLLKGVCCINTVSQCGATVTLNNTFWQTTNAPPSPSSNCPLTINLDSAKFVEQPKPICQIRLDFVSFSIAQPNSETVCSTDSFQVTGPLQNKVPIICGDNNGQHMYLDIPSSRNTPQNINLAFTFGALATTRSWNIKISMLPCGANYLAPPNCLQYFNGATSGTISSFNWKDVTSTATRQLANQDYNICFRNELINNNVAKTVCFSPCSVAQAATAFSLSTANTASTGLSATSVTGQSQNLGSNCNNDYLVIEGGFNPAVPKTTPTNALDRYCGERLNPLAAQTISSTVCTGANPFSILYRTDGDETLTATVDGVAGANVNGNLGFCLSYQLS